MSASIEIRPATVVDVPGVLPLVQRLADVHRAWDIAKYPYKPDVGEMYRNWMTARATDDRSVFFVAAREGRIIGFVIGTVEREIPIYTLAEFGFIHDLWVDTDYRNEGIARQLVTLAIERFTQIGVAQIRLDTAADNEIARSLFRKCGFRPSTVEMLLETTPTALPEGDA
jgi:ribosomal protein S18 acetylase RimI-like enzyme